MLRLHGGTVVDNTELNINIGLMGFLFFWRMVALKDIKIYNYFQRLKHVVIFINDIVIEFLTKKILFIAHKYVQIQK